MTDHPLALDMQNTAFSAANSYIRLIRSPHQPNRLALGTCRTNATKPDPRPQGKGANLFEIIIERDGQEIPYCVSCMPWHLLLHGEKFSATLAFSDPETVIFEIEGASLYLAPFHLPVWAHHQNSQTYTSFGMAKDALIEVRCSSESTVMATRGEPYIPEIDTTRDQLCHLRLQGQDRIHGSIRIGEFESEQPRSIPSVQDISTLREGDVLNWMSKMPLVPERYLTLATKAWVNLWLARVPPTRTMTRPGMFSSKFHQNRTWLWHACLSAITIAKAEPLLAWAQIRLFIDHQAPTGMLPDALDDSNITYGFTKPPLFGWAILQLIDLLGVDLCRTHLEACYLPLVHNTEWWLQYRDLKHELIPHYMHRFDSGWDEATTFDDGWPVSTPDLPAILSIQMDALATMASILGKPTESQEWASQASAVREALFRHRVKNNRFFSTKDGTKEIGPNSLLNHIPFVLGRKLPAPVFSETLAQLSGHFLTPYGLATEATDSSLYSSTARYRGGIAGHINYFFVQALEDADEIQLAATVAERYCEASFRDPSLHEFMDSSSGKGLGCQGHLASACGVILMAHWLYQHARR